jgi:hypothetical protein
MERYPSLSGSEGEIRSTHLVSEAALRCFEESGDYFLNAQCIYTPTPSATLFHREKRPALAPAELGTSERRHPSGDPSGTFLRGSSAADHVSDQKVTDA